MATQTTGGGSTTSFTNTPQAQDDAYVWTEDELLALDIYSAATKTITLDVMAGDLGGKAKTLFSIDAGVDEDGNPITTDYDLLVKDVVNGVSPWEQTAAGNWIRIYNGKIEFRIDDGSGTPGSARDVNSLGEGETIYDEFVYAIRLGNGTLSQARVTFSLTGANDNATINVVANGDYAVTEAGVNPGDMPFPGDPNASGQVTVSDVDAGEAVFQAVAPAALVGTYGTFTFIAATGVWTYTLDNDRPATQALSGGAAVTDTLTVTSFDGTASHNIVVNITGTNDKPTVTAGAQSVQLVEAGVSGAGTAAASITLTKADPDSGDAAVYDGAALIADGWATGDGGATYTKTGIYGTATLTTATGVVSYALDNNDVDTNALADGAGVSDNFTVYVKDGSNATASTAVNFAITGSNDNPTVTAGAQDFQLVEAGVGGAGTAAASITLTKADPDTGDAAVYDGTALIADGWATGDGGATYTKTGLYGTATLTTATGVVSYALDNNDVDTNALAGGAAVSDDFTVYVKDGSTGTASAAVNFAITGANDAPVIDVDNAASYTVGGAAAVVDPTIGITDIDSTMISGALVQITTNRQAGDVLNFVNQSGISGSFNAGSGLLTLSGSATLAQYELALESITFSSSSTSTLTRTVSFQVTDNGGATSAADTATVNVSAPANQAPTDIRLTIGSALVAAAAGVAGNDNIIENTTIAAGTVIGTLSAVDPDVGNTHTFTIVSDLTSRFEIVSGNVLQLKAGQTIAQNDADFSVTIRVTDNNLATYDEMFPIKVGTAGNNTVNGTDTGGLGTVASPVTGDDIIFGFRGADTLNPGVTLQGTSGDDALFGGTNSDTLYGGLGNDQLFGGADNDTLFGQGGNDILNGGAGNDMLHGGAGDNILTGGADNDTFVFQNLTSTTNHITDFEAGTNLTTVDKLRFDAGVGLNEFSVGNNNTTVDNFKSGNNGTINAANTEVAVKTDASVTNANVQSTIDSYGNITTGAFFVFHNTDLGHAAVYYDANPSAPGGAVLVAEIDNMTTLGSLANFNTGDFEFV